jgi:AraC-like DNA-binding protein
MSCMHDNSSAAGSPAIQRDSLSEVLMDLRPVGVSYGRCEMRDQWGIAFEPIKAARFHFLAHGTAWIRVEERDWQELRAGDAVLLPWAAAHALAAKPDIPTQDVRELRLEPWGERTYKVRVGDDGAPPNLLFCGTVEFETGVLHPLLDLMPVILTVRAADEKDISLRALLDAMAEEVKAQRIGAATVLTRLADAVVVKLLRTWHEENREPSGLLAAIRDRRIGRVLVAIHRRPGDRWTVESMAAEAHLSRSAFAERFSAVVGRPVASYLAQLRMHLASQWLRDPHTSIAEVATRLGYESEASFSRAFKRLQGMPPSASRGVGEPLVAASSE